MAVRKDRNAKAELNRRSQACEALTGTGISRREKWTGRRVTLPLGLAPEASASLVGYVLENPKRTEPGIRPLLRPCEASAGTPGSLGKNGPSFAQGYGGHPSL